MQKFDICCVGHITLDKVVTPRQTVYMPGGTSFYFSHAICCFDDIEYLLVTSLAESEMGVVDDLREKGVSVNAFISQHSVYFENIYGDNPDNRTQRVLAKADPFSFWQVENVGATYYHLGALLADDFPLDMVKQLSQKGLVSIDSQGYLREVRNQKVYAIDWQDKREALKYIHTLKVNESEMEVLTGYSDISKAAYLLHEWGVSEILITLGSLGSVIFDGCIFHKIPAYKPAEIVDATGCGDTYNIGYLYQRAKGRPIQQAGEFAAAMATIKIGKSGPFEGTVADVMEVIRTAEKAIPEI